MHILQINTEKGWRGGERQTVLSMEGLRDAGVDVTLLCLRDRPLVRKAREAGFSVIAVSNQLGALRHCIFHGGNYSVMHAQSSRGFGFAAVATLFTGTPLVYTRRVDFVPRGILTKWKYRRAAALVAISGAIRDVLHNAGMGEAEVISSIVSDHVPDASRCSLLRQEQHTDGHRIVGVIAALVGHKDPLTMVRAAAIVHRRIPDIVFLHFGEGELRTAAEEECGRLNLDGVYRLLGHRNDVEDYFPLFDCFAMSSREEGLGSTVLDAFKNGVPVASTSAGGLAELVQGRGLLSLPGDPGELAENIIHLIERRADAKHRCDAARAYVGEHHNREIQSRRNIEIYRRIIRPRIH
jgi:glycosyltransferase involved in cell wall biosynthesis